MREGHAKGVHPERVGLDRVAGGDVAGHAFFEAELREKPEAGCQPFLTVLTLLFGRVELRERGHPLLNGHGSIMRRSVPPCQAWSARPRHSSIRPCRPMSNNRLHSGHTGYFFGSRLGTQTLPHSATT